MNHLNLGYLSLIILSACFLNYSEQRNSKKILLLTDIHLNQNYSSNVDKSNECSKKNRLIEYILNDEDYGKYGCDSNINLLESVLEDIKLQNNGKFDLIIINGDSLSHTSHKSSGDINQQNLHPLQDIKKTFEAIKSRIVEKLNNTNILYVVGNNDFREQYNLPDKESLIKQVEIMEHTFMKEISSEKKSYFNPDFLETINKGFYYTFDFSPKLRFLIINTNLFSKKNTRVDENSLNNVAIEHMKWIEEQFKIAEKENKKVILLGHIPPFLNYFHHEMEFLYKEKFAQLFKETLYKAKDTLLYNFFSHCHLPRVAVRFNIEKSNKKITCKNFNSKYSRRDKSTQEFLKSPADSGEEALGNLKYSEIKKFNFTNDELAVKFYSSSIFFPSLSPVYKNSPGYSIIHFDEEENKIANIEQKFFNLKEAHKIHSMIKNSESLDISPFDIIKEYIDDIESNDDSLFNSFADIKMELPEIDIFGLENNSVDKNKFSRTKHSYKKLSKSDNNRLYYKKILLRILWNNSISFKRDFGFTNFDSNDFADFVFSRLYKQKFLKKYFCYIVGRSEKEYKEVMKQLKEQGQMDEKTNYENFREIFYKIEKADCSMGE